jgi:hypothetical protein
MAGFQPTLYGRIWVTAEVPKRKTNVIFGSPQAVDSVSLSPKKRRILRTFARSLAL